METYTTQQFAPWTKWQKRTYVVAAATAVLLVVDLAFTLKDYFAG